MRRFLSLMLCMAMLAGMLSVAVSADSGYDVISGDPESFNAGSSAGKMYDGAAWANYYFACSDNGLHIFNINTGEQVAHWVFDKSVTKLESANNTPFRIVVNDDYIAVLTGSKGKTSVVIYENAQSYTNALPTPIGTFGLFEGENPLLYMDGEDIWVVDLRKTTITRVMGDSTWTIPLRSVACWNMNVAKLKENSYSYVTTDRAYGQYVNLSNAGLYAVGAVNVVAGGRHDYLWTESETDGTYIYYTTYNNTTSAPNLTLQTNRFNMRDMTFDSAESCTIANEPLSGMSVEFETADDSLTKTQLQNALKALEVYEYDPSGYVPDENGAKLGDFASSLSFDINKIDAGATEDENDVDRWSVKFTISDAGELASKVKFEMEEGDEEVTSLDIVEGIRLVAFTYEDKEYQLSYSNVNNEFSTGAMAIKDDTLYVFVCSNNIWSYETNEKTRMYILNIGDEGILKVADYQTFPISARAKVITAVTVGNALVGTVDGVGQSVYFLNITNSPDMDMNIPEKIVTNAANSPSNQNFRASVHHGRRVFYGTNNGETVAIETVGEGLTIESAEEFNEKAVYLYGFSNEEDGVTVTVDGVSNEVSSYGGVWALAVENIKNGTHTVTVMEDGEEAEATITTYSAAMEEKETGIATAVANCADGAALIEYLKGNPDAAQFLGLDIEGSYSEFDAAVQEDIMDAVLPLLKSGSGAAEKFDTEVSKAYKAQQEKDALEAVNDADKDTIGGVFETYKDILFATDDAQDVWKDYLKNKSKKSKIHKNFVGYDDCEDIDDVAKNLAKAIKKANEKEDTGSGNGGTTISGGSKNDTSYKTPTTPVEIYQPITNVTFGDVAKDYWGYEAITTLATKGIINGVGGDSFAPEETVTREAFVKMLVEALGLKGKGEGMTFSDVDTNAWYADYVYIASSIGLAQGYDGKFGIGEGLTREQMATMLYRAAEIANINLEAKNDAKDFTDNAEIGDYAVEAVNALSQAGIINGMDNGTYAPKTVCNRAMAAKVIYEILAIK